MSAGKLASTTVYTVTSVSHQLGYHTFSVLVPRDGCDGRSIVSSMKLRGGFAPSRFIL